MGALVNFRDAQTASAQYRHTNPRLYAKVMKAIRADWSQGREALIQARQESRQEPPKESA